MFKNRSIQMKVVKDTPQENAPRLSDSEMETIKEIAKIAGKYYLAKVAVDALLTIYLKNSNA